MTDEAKFILTKYFRPRLAVKGEVGWKSDQRLTNLFDEIDSLAGSYGVELSVQPRSKS